MAGDRVPEEFKAEMTLTVKGTPGGGILTALAASGDMSSELFSRLFYAGPELPPDDLDPVEFWAAILGSIAGYLGSSLLSLSRLACWPVLMAAVVGRGPVR